MKIQISSVKIIHTSHLHDYIRDDKKEAQAINQLCSEEQVKNTTSNEPQEDQYNMSTAGSAGRVNHPQDLRLVSHKNP